MFWNIWFEVEETASSASASTVEKGSLKRVVEVKSVTININIFII